MQRLIPRLMLAATLAFSFALSGSAQAHDYWLRLDSEAVIRPGTDAEIRMWVGDKLGRGEEDEYRASKAKSFVHISAAGTVDLKARARDGATPLITLPELPAGGHLVAMTRTYSHVTLPGWKFGTYLMAEEFSEVLAARKDAGATWSAGKERYSRYLKTLVQVGWAADAIYGSVLGQKYEIVLLNDPMALAAGGTLALRVLFEGKLAAGVRVVARSREHGSIDARTDSSGGVKFVLPARGEWLIRSVTMRSCSSCKRADWESFWASYHFIQFGASPAK
jgi:uncharacterized GH25 family protein